MIQSKNRTEACMLVTKGLRQCGYSFESIIRQLETELAAQGNKYWFYTGQYSVAETLAAVARDAGHTSRISGDGMIGFQLYVEMCND